MFFFFILISGPAGLSLAVITISYCVAWSTLDMLPNVLLLDQDVVVGGYEKKQNGELGDHTSTK